MSIKNAMVRLTDLSESENSLIITDNHKRKDSIALGSIKTIELKSPFRFGFNGMIWNEMNLLLLNFLLSAICCLVFFPFFGPSDECYCLQKNGEYPCPDLYNRKFYFANSKRSALAYPIQSFKKSLPYFRKYREPITVYPQTSALDLVSTLDPCCTRSTQLEL